MALLTRMHAIRLAGCVLSHCGGVQRMTEPRRDERFFSLLLRSAGLFLFGAIRGVSRREVLCVVRAVYVEISRF